MVSKLYDTGVLYDAPPVPGAKEAIQKLKDMGYTYVLCRSCPAVASGDPVRRLSEHALIRSRIIIITARSESARETSEDWLAEHMPDRTLRQPL